VLRGWSRSFGRIPNWMALIRHLVRMVAQDDKCSEAVVPGPYRLAGKPFVRRLALVNSQEPGGINASPSS
jgi:hypothetical protein